MAGIISLCFIVPGLALLALSFIFVADHDLLWRKAREIEGMLPPNFERTRQWDLQMLLLGVMMGMMGLLCIGMAVISLSA
jgi:hypothetical protein